MGKRLQNFSNCFGRTWSKKVHFFRTHAKDKDVVSSRMYGINGVLPTIDLTQHKTKSTLKSILYIELSEPCTHLPWISKNGVQNISKWSDSSSIDMHWIYSSAKEWARKIKQQKNNQKKIIAMGDADKAVLKYNRK